jgi:serine protease Do
MRRFLFLLLLVILLGFSYHRWNLLREANEGRRAAEQFTPAQTPPLDLKDVQVLSAIDAEYSRLIDAAMPSVVCIRSPGVAPMDPFEMLFRRQLGAPAPVKRSLSSGLIDSAEGQILTNAHEIEGMQQIAVQLTVGRTVPAQLIGADKQTDIAVLRISAPRIAALPLGDSEGVRVGQMVFAIGNPFGLQESVSQGIISAKGRAISDNGVEFLQTDAAVNQGNSGGPLVNLRGEIIGINSAIYSETGGWLGISFAIPANTARRAMESILKTGRVVRPYLGVLMGDLNEELARQFQAPDTRGALLHDVMPNSPAAEAGLRPGDIVRSVNQRPVTNSAQLRNEVAAAGIGASLQIGFLRAGEERNVTAQLIESPSNPPQPSLNSPRQSLHLSPQNPQSDRREPSRDIWAFSGFADLELSDLSAAVADQLPSGVQGVLIRSVGALSRSDSALRPGDIIERVNRVPVRSLEEFKNLASQLPADRQVLLQVAREDTRLLVVLAPRR